MTRRALWIAALAASIAATARAGDDKCSVEPVPKPRETAFDLAYPDPRYHELSIEVGYWGTAFPIHSTFVAVMTYSLALVDQRLHLGVRAGGAFGGWGPEDRGSYALSLGARFAGDFARSATGLVDWYGFAQADALLLSARDDAVLRPAAGLGVRLMRAIAFEVGFEPAVSLGARFADGSPLSPGFGFALSFDLCSELALGCSSKQPQPTEKDLTALLYADARDLASSADHAKLCAGVKAGLDTDRYYAHDQVDATGAFLKGARDNVTDPGLAAKLDELAKTHARYRAELVESRDATRKARQAGTHLAESCAYAPYPVELRDAFGCPP